MNEQVLSQWMPNGNNYPSGAFGYVPMEIHDLLFSKGLLGIYSSYGDAWAS